MNRDYYTVLLGVWDENMLKDRGIRRGIEVFVRNPSNPDMPEKKAIVVNTYPPSQ